MTKERVSIREVSRRSGVSVSTVSRIINQSGRFSPKTAARVYQVMQELDYVPNKLAQSMRTHQNLVIGILIPDILNEIHALMVRTMQTDLIQEGYITTIFNTGDSAEVTSRCVDMMRAQRMMGVVCIPARTMTGVEVGSFPTVYLGRRPEASPGEGTVLVQTDNELAGYLAGRELVEKGCKRPGVLMDTLPLSTHEARLAGFRRALHEAGLALEPEVIYRENSEKTTTTIRLMEQQVHRPGFPDGIFAMEARMAVGMLKVIQANQLPTHLVGYGKIRLADYGLLDFDCVHEPVQEMAHAAVRQLLALAQTQVEDTEDVTFPPTLHHKQA